MRTVQRLSDRFLDLFVKKVEADAIWIWVNFCDWAGSCSPDGSHWYPIYWHCYCHDGSGECNQCSVIGCCD